MARILICDDSDFLRQRISEVLSNGGHKIAGEAVTGVEAAEKYTSLKPDLVTMDIIMEGGGSKAVKKIKELDKNAKIVIISILEGNQAEVIEAIKSGARGYVSKPIKDEVLLSEIERVLNKL